MYSNFFGFKERPFKLLPDPTYLFLSKSHEEALAHLKYAVAHGDGFVEITGEVGTGKTTLCRVFLDQLPEDTEAAYIFNPRLDEVQLLKAINDELHVTATGNTAKELVDALNAYLMQMKAAGRNVIVIIDEAQNLSVEVLEQLRLLSNLETTRSKLIQIILVGQPELADMLDSRALRQLGQRVTLSCHLAPLTFKETSAYIEHRLQIALTKPEHLFSQGALREIYNHANGIPRLINILCDRSLLIAYSRNRKRVSRNMVRMAIRELWSRGDHRKRFPFRRRTLAAALTGAVVVAAVLLLPGIVQRDSGLVMLTEPPAPAAVVREASAPEGTPAPPVSDMPEAAAAAPSNPEPPAPDPTAPVQAEPAGDKASVSVSLKAYLEQVDPAETRYNSLAALLSMWSVEGAIQPYLVSIKDDDTFFNLVTQQHGLEIQVIDGNPDLVRKLNLPAIFKFEHPGQKMPIYLALQKIEAGQAVFRSQGLDADVTIAYDALASQFRGKVFVAWRNHLGFEGTLPFTYPKGSVIMLKMMLRDMGYDDVALTPLYDNRTQEIIRDIQQRHGIKADGFVGPMTKIVLYNEKGDYPIPQLVVREKLLDQRS